MVLIEVESDEEDEKKLEQKKQKAIQEARTRRQLERSRSEIRRASPTRHKEDAIASRTHHRSRTQTSGLLPAQHVTPGGPDDGDDVEQLEAAFLRASRESEAKRQERKQLADALLASQQQFQKEQAERKSTSGFQRSPREDIRRVSSRDFLRGRQPTSSSSPGQPDSDLAFLEDEDSEDSLLDLHHSSSPQRTEQGRDGGGGSGSGSGSGASLKHGSGASLKHGSGASLKSGTGSNASLKGSSGGKARSKVKASKGKAKRKGGKARGPPMPLPEIPPGEEPQESEADLRALADLGSGSSVAAGRSRSKGRGRATPTTTPKDRKKKAASRATAKPKSKPKAKVKPKAQAQAQAPGQKGEAVAAAGEAGGGEGASQSKACPKCTLLNPAKATRCEACRHKFQSSGAAQQGGEAEHKREGKDQVRPLPSPAPLSRSSSKRKISRQRSGLVDLAAAEAFNKSVSRDDFFTKRTVADVAAAATQTVRQRLKFALVNDTNTLESEFASLQDHKATDVSAMARLCTNWLGRVRSLALIEPFLGLPTGGRVVAEARDCSRDAARLVLDLQSIPEEAWGERLADHAQALAGRMIALVQQLRVMIITAEDLTEVAKRVLAKDHHIADQHFMEYSSLFFPCCLDLTLRKLNTFPDLGPKVSKALEAERDWMVKACKDAALLGTLKGTATHTSAMTKHAGSHATYTRLVATLTSCEASRQQQQDAAAAMKTVRLAHRMVGKAYRLHKEDKGSAVLASRLDVLAVETDGLSARAPQAIRDAHGEEPQGCCTVL